MIFLGDFVFPFSKIENYFRLDEEFKKKPKVLNLESLILEPYNHKKTTSGIALHSSDKSMQLLQELNVKAVGLANNHIADYDFNIKKMQDILIKKGISSVGAGSNLDNSIKPVFIEDTQYKYIVFAFGWDVIGCKNAKENLQGVAPLNEKLIIEIITNTKLKYPDHKIVLFLHWNYEFEYYPQPADRKLAFNSIDSGADIIIGHHPHIVGVFELYKNKPIFYSLGNFFIPEYNFDGFDLKYSDLANTGLGIEYNEDPEKIVLYWIKNYNNKIKIDSSELLYNSNKIKSFSDHFQNDLGSYSNWFKKNRRKKKLLPIYKEHNKSLKNNILYVVLTIRNYIIHKVTSYGLRKRNN